MKQRSTLRFALPLIAAAESAALLVAVLAGPDGSAAQAGLVVGLAVALVATVVMGGLIRSFERRLEWADNDRHAVALRVRELADLLPARISQFDRDQRVLYANRYCGEVYGCAPEELVGKTILEVRGPAAHARMQGHIEQVLLGRHVRHEHAMDVAGRLRHFQQDFVPSFDARGRVNGFASLSFDITERKLAEQALAASERSLRDIADNLPALIAYVDRELQLRFVNATFERWVGIKAQQAIGRRLSELLGEEGSEVRKPYLMRALAGETVSFEAPLSVNGQHRDTQITYLPDRQADGGVGGVYALVNDISSLKKVERQLNDLARVDPLTGLPNRRELETRLAAALTRSRDSGHGMALFFLDVDDFKGINDRYGHAGGDAVLRHFAQHLRASVRETDTVARLAGDEFVVIGHGLDHVSQLDAIAKKIVEAIREPLMLEHEQVAVTTSVGIAHVRAGGASAAELLKRADEALYEAKAAGRNTWRIAPAET